MRIVSLVPSITELLIDLNLEQELVGRTKFCIHPHNKVSSIPKIGGTKNINLQAVLDLRPDLIVANKEENIKADIEFLMHSSNVLVTEIADYEDALKAILQLGQVTNRTDESQNLVVNIKAAFSELKALKTEGKKVCYLIWNDPLMSIGKDTFIHSMLTMCGFENVFKDRSRYPSLDIESLEALKPDFIFLSSEPFPFKEDHLKKYQSRFPKSKVVLVDGEFFSWYGSRMIQAADYFNRLIKSLT